MKLSDIMRGAGLNVDGRDAGRAHDTSVTGFAIDHRKVAPGTVFGAFQGARFDAEQVIPAAIEAGAIAVIARPQAQVEGAIHIESDEPRRTFAKLAAQFFTPVPATIVAVTGTNGKTSCVEMTRQIWRMCGERAASIGTLGVTTPDESVSTGLTTPDIVTFLSNMSGLAREGVTHVAYEASSHGLTQFRNEGVRVAVGAFTNFSRDHLDYHATMDDYFAAKMRLFDEVVADDGIAIIWRGDDVSADDVSADDAGTDDAGTDDSEPDWTQRAIRHADDRGLETLTVGPGGSFMRLVKREPTQLGQTLGIEHDGQVHEVRLPLIGAYQAANAMVSAALAIATGSRAGQVFDALGRLQPVRGRLERAVITPSGVPVYVDYAHTPDALEAAIAALRPHVDEAAGGKLIVVFGAGGDRDTGKRAPMGRVAATGADVVLVTDDNPRSEDPAKIRAEIVAGADGGGVAAMRDIAGRRQAIDEAIRAAGTHDIVLIAGKGHEQGQIIGTGDNMQVLPFDDVEVARECAAGVSGS